MAAWRRVTWQVPLSFPNLSVRFLAYWRGPATFGNFIVGMPCLAASSFELLDQSGAPLESEIAISDALMDARDEWVDVTL